MRWMITDSGLGGLSVCGGLEHALSTRTWSEDIEILYVNATPEDRRGYNSLTTQSERIALFNRFLTATTQRYRPDAIAIACNTLSVIYADTDFARGSSLPVNGIVGAGVDLCNQQLRRHPERDLIIFATETTTEAAIYPQLIQSSGSAIIPQECPELAHAISNDATGTAAAVLLETYIGDAVQSLRPQTTDVYAFLGCTHYGYQSDLFENLLSELGYSGQALDPNQHMVNQLFSSLAETLDEGVGKLSVRFISRYDIPGVEINAMQNYLKDAAPLTMEALRQHDVIPELFAGFET